MNQSEDYVYNLYKINQDIDSLDRPFATQQGKNFAILDFISDYNQNIENKIEQSFLSLRLQEIMNEAKLNEAEKETLYLRYGLELTLEEAAKVQNVSYEWVRQLQIKALKKMRNVEKMRFYAIYMDNPNQAQKNLELLKHQEGKKLKQLKSDINSTKKESEEKQENLIIEEEKIINTSKIHIFEHYMPLDINYGPYQVRQNDTKKFSKRNKGKNNVNY